MNCLKHVKCVKFNINFPTYTMILEVRKLLGFWYCGDIASFRIGLSNACVIRRQSSMVASAVISYRFEALI